MNWPKASLKFAEFYIKNSEEFDKIPEEKKQRNQYGQSLFVLPKEFIKSKEFIEECWELRNSVNDYFKDSNKDPYDWQIQAAVILSKGKIVLDIPTSFGKSHVICLAAINLMRQGFPISIYFPNFTIFYSNTKLWSIIFSIFEAKMYIKWIVFLISESSPLEL